MTKRFLSWKKESRDNYGTQTEQGKNLSAEDVQAGATQRIADALEVLIQNRLHELAEYKEAIKCRDNWKRSYNEERNNRRKAERRISAFKAQITRLKKKKVK